MGKCRAVRGCFLRRSGGLFELQDQEVFKVAGGMEEGTEASAWT